MCVCLIHKTLGISVEEGSVKEKLDRALVHVATQHFSLFHQRGPQGPQRQHPIRRKLLCWGGTRVTVVSVLFAIMFCWHRSTKRPHVTALKFISSLSISIKLIRLGMCETFFAISALHQRCFLTGMGRDACFVWRPSLRHTNSALLTPNRGRSGRQVSVSDA